MNTATIGIDISKDTLDVHRHPNGDERRFANDAAGHKALIRWIGGDDSPIVFEPTGPYHARLEKALTQAGRRFAKINPRQARDFAKAIGQAAKTDRLDASLLARMGALLQVKPSPPWDENLAELRELAVARNGLIKDRTAAKNRAKRLTLPILKRQTAARLKHIDRELAAVDEEIQRRIADHPFLAKRLDILTSITSMGTVTAALLLIEMPELGSLEPGQAASLAGLAPMTRQSGKWRGKAFIQGGRASVRKALYMPALVAIRYNPELRAVYKRLTAAGKPPRVAITAVMRKLIVLANALLKADRKWQPRTA